MRMKKLLTFLTLLTLFFTTAWATETTVNASKVTSQSFTWTGSGGETWSGTVVAGATNQSFYSTGYAQIGSSGSPSSSVTLSTSDIPGTITSIVIDCAAYQGKATVSATVGGNAFGTQNQSVPRWSDSQGGEVTFTGSASGAIAITMKNGSGGRAMYIKSVTVTYSTGSTPTCAMPTITITPASGPYYVNGDPVTATIACSDPTDATILYRFNNTGDWNTYSSAVEIPNNAAGTVTIQAKATKSGYNDSGSANESVTFENPPAEPSTVAEIVALDNNTNFTFKGSLVVSGQATYNNHKYLYAQDATGGMLFFDANEDYEFGDLIPSGFTGTKTTFNGAPEVTNADMDAANTHGQTLNAEELAPDGIIAGADGYNVFEYSVIKNATITLESGKYYINVGDDKVQIYDRFGHAVPSDYADKEYDVYGVSGWYNGAQFMPLDYVVKVITKYAVTCAEATNGEISTDNDEYAEGETVTVTVTPSPGYELATLVYNDGSDHNITATEGVYSFEMPAHAVTITATFAKAKYSITYNVLPENSGTVWIVNGGNDINGVRMAEEGTRITIKQVQYSGYFMNTLTIKDADGNTISYDTGDTNDYGGGYGTYFMFDMPASNVIITATFKPGNMYILGTVNDKEWAGNDGVQMNYDSENEKWTADVYINDADAAFSFTEWLGDANWNNMGPRYGAETNDYNLTQHGYSGTLYGDRYNNAFLLPTGIYTIEIDKNKTTVTVTKVEPTLTFTPAPGEYTSEIEVSVSSNLYELLHAINSNISETDVTNMVKTDGDYAASAPITATATVTGRAKYGYIEETATADYTISQENNNTQYQRVSSTDDLVSGKKYIIVYEGDSEAMAEKPSGSNHRLAESVVIDAEHITDIAGKDDVAVLILGGSTDAWTFQVAANNKYLSLAGSSAYLTEVDEVGSENKEQFTISFNNDAANDKSDALIVNNNTNTKSIRHNVASGIGRFGLYNTLNNQGNENTSQPIVQLYRQVENVVTQKVATPVFTPGTGTFTSTQNVEITCATTGATILYKTSEMTEYAEYLTAIEVSQNTTITAYATKNGYTDSDEASATYTFVEPGTDKYVLVTSAAQLVPGNEYIIVAATANPAAAFGAISSNSGTAATGFSINSDISEVTLTNPSDVKVFTLGKEGTGEYCWTFKSNNKYLYAESAGNRINEDGGSSYSNLFYISINPGNTPDIHFATIQAGGGHQIMYNGSSFRHWASSNLSTTPGTYKNVYLYTKGAVVETPTEATLAQIITLGDEADGKLYKISNEDGLLGVYSQGQSVWFKDEYPEQAVDYQDPLENTNYKYYTVVEDALEINKSEKDFDQSNWIEVVFQDNASYNNKYVKNLTGTYSWQNGNPKLTLTVDVDETNDVTDVPVGALAYDLNPYMAANFAGTQDGTIQGETHTYFFSKPKAQEYAQILWAVWDGSKFNMPTTNNAYGFTGSFTVSDELNGGVSLDGLQQGKTYNFKAVIRKTASKAGSYEVYPTDLNPGVVTGVGMINVNGNVKSVKYVNVAGIVSDVPFQGVNIVVTEYTDGSRTTTKMLKK